jgi:hypothetical protein
MQYILSRILYLRVDLTTMKYRYRCCSMLVPVPVLDKKYRHPCNCDRVYPFEYDLVRKGFTENVSVANCNKSTCVNQTYS